VYRMHCATSCDYDVVFTRDVLDPSNRLLAEAVDSRPALIITDRTVHGLLGDRLRAYTEAMHAPVGVLALDLTEHTKTMATVLEICARAEALGLGRRDPLVALGGGICSDVVSVAASLMRRGVPYIAVPTTLIGQVDAGIALKGGVNFSGTKNYLGCFTPPKRVLIDTGFLTSVPRGELSGGFAEIVKMALILDDELFEAVALSGPELIRSGLSAPEGVGETIVKRAVELMLDQLGENCYEDRTLKRLVDFGHTFSPRLEELSGYRLRHGEAVAVDMALTCALATELGAFGEHELETVITTLRSLALPVHSPVCTRAAIDEAIESTTKHRDGTLNLVIPTGIGHATFVDRASDIPAAAVDAALERVTAAAMTSDTSAQLLV
jgi:2-epi-5-epi-valiolone synthase